MNGAVLWAGMMTLTLGVRLSEEGASDPPLLISVFAIRLRRESRAHEAPTHREKEPIGLRAAQAKRTSALTDV